MPLNCRLHCFCRLQLALSLLLSSTSSLLLLLPPLPPHCYRFAHFMPSSPSEFHLQNQIAMISNDLFVQFVQKALKINHYTNGQYSCDMCESQANWMEFCSIIIHFTHSIQRLPPISFLRPITVSIFDFCSLNLAFAFLLTHSQTYYTYVFIQTYIPTLTPSASASSLRPPTQAIDADISCMCMLFSVCKL